MVQFENWQKRKILASKDHQLAATQEIDSLIVQERRGKDVVLSDGTQLTEFISCSYLGLDQDVRVVAASLDTVRSCGVNFAVSRTRMRVQSFYILENLLNKIFCNRYTTLFTSLHLAHLGVLPVLSSGEMPSFPIENKPVFILDKRVHASVQIIRGVLTQFGEVHLVDFGSKNMLEKEMHDAYENKITPILIADGIGSMGGVCPVDLLFSLADTYDGYVYIDDAHGTSVYGEHGCGYVLEMLGHRFHPRLILAASLSKGFGCNGGVIVVPTQEDEEMIKRFSSTYIFGNPLPLSIVDSSIACAIIHLSPELSQLQKKLRDNLTYFDSEIGNELKIEIKNKNTFIPIRCIPIGDEFEAIDCAAHLKQQGLMVSAAMYPTVEKGKSILRITISADHTKDSIHMLCNSIKKYL